MRKLLAVSLIWCLCPALLPSLCLWNQLPETIDNYTLCLFSKDSQSVGQAGTLHLFFQLPFLLHLPLLPQTSENRGFLISVACSNPPVTIAMPLGVCQALRQKNLFKNITQDLSQGWMDKCEEQGVGDSVRELLQHSAPPVFWNFTPDQVKSGEKGKKI